MCRLRRRLGIVHQPALEHLVGALLGDFLVRVEGLVESLPIHGESLLAADFLGELQREPVGVVQPEHDPAGERGLAELRHLLQDLVQLRHSAARASSRTCPLRRPVRQRYARGSCRAQDTRACSCRSRSRPAA